MSGDDHGSVTRWIAVLRDGQSGAVQPLWERYFSRMVELARVRLRSSRHKDAGVDDGDAALSGFDSVCAGLARGRFPQLADRDKHWTERPAVSPYKRGEEAWTVALRQVP